jgi:ethanolamine utilization protein EutQ (cupin superfamily)
LLRRTSISHLPISVSLYNHPNPNPHSQSTSPSTPISGGFYRLEKGTPLDYTYSYDEMKIILEGHFYIKDETGKEVKAEKGDVFHFPKGSRIIFRTDDYGLAFFVGQREEGKL